MSQRVLVARYAGFAVLAMFANLGMQRLVLLGGSTEELFVPALAAGTVAGLVVKYLLDKHWIFYDRVGGLRAHGRKFTLYTAMGVVTTCIFWGTETAFWLVWGTDRMRELGALLGLTVGYAVKYRLDRRYVFAGRGEQASRNPGLAA